MWRMQRVTDACRRQFVGREDGSRGRSMVRSRCGDGAQSSKKIDRPFKS